MCSEAPSNFTCKLHVEGVQSVVPTSPTDPRQSCRIHVPQVDLGSTAILQRRFHLLLGYTKGYDGDSGWLVAGLIKESLGRALMEQPLLAGRVRRCEHSDTDLELVSNDSGARLVEARADMSFHDFVEVMKLKKTEAETHLVFWEDVLENNPQFSPLFYVQVTNFSCGGYSIGISCSLLLMDPFVLTNFLKKWSDIHKNMVSNVTKFPTFYLPSHGKTSSSPTQLMGSNTCNNTAQTVIFKIQTSLLNPNTNIHKNLAALCINEAERHVGLKLPSNLSLFLKLPHEDAKVEFCSRKGLLESQSSECNIINEFSCSRTWNELGLESVCLNEGNKPIYVSCWINSVVDEGSVMVVPIDANISGFQIVVTFT